MAPHYERPQQSTSEDSRTTNSAGGGLDDEAIDGAAEALRHAEVEAVKPDGNSSVAAGQAAPDNAPSGKSNRAGTVDVAALAPSELANMSIDELRGVAAALDVPEREKTIEQDELIEAIRRRLPR